MNNKKYIALFFFLLFGHSCAYATLLERADGTMLYDTDLDITWLADANYSMTSGVDSDGRMDWFESNTWASNLDFGGFSDWRLPETIQPDSNCSFHNSQVDAGYNCIASEMGHLFYVDLGGSANSPLPTQTLFSNFQLENYWSGTTVAPSDPDNSWYFNFGSGWQGGQLQTPYSFYALAVRNGDVVSVPLPPTIFLLGLGIAMLARANKVRSRVSPLKTNNRTPGPVNAGC